MNTPTRYEYATGSCMNSYPTAANVSDGITGETLRATMTWACASGQLLTSTDPNQLTTTRTYDLFDRVLSVTEASDANQRTTTMSYSDINKTVTTIAPLDSRTLTTTETYDARGRAILTQVPNASCTQATIEHRYLTPQSSDTVNYGFSYELVSNPYCATAETTMGWTRTKRESQRTSDGGCGLLRGDGSRTVGANSAPTAISTTDYTLGDQVDSTDPAGKKRRTRVDGLGRMAQVVEDPDLAPYSTTYGYDVRDGLKSVTQTRKAAVVADVAQNRTFNGMSHRVGAARAAYHRSQSGLRSRQRIPDTPRAEPTPLLHKPVAPEQAGRTSKV
jgi:YD repeat-containing protein